MPDRRSRRSLTLAASLAMLLAGSPAWAQQTALQDPLLDRMVGHWVLRGTIGGQQTVHDVDAHWVLGHEYLRLREVSRERGPNGAPAYEAIVFLGRDPVAGGHACLWLDNTSNGGLREQAIGHAPPGSHDRMAFLFDLGGGTRFHTTFVYEAANGGSWRWLMDGENRTGALEPFARLAMTRQ